MQYKGCRKFIIGIGGSATTKSGGIGMLSALGYDFMDEKRRQLPPVFDSLEKVVQIKIIVCAGSVKRLSFSDRV